MILTLSVLSHFVAFQFKPLHLFRTNTTSQTVESPVKINPEAIQEVFRRQA